MKRIIALDDEPLLTNLMQEIIGDDAGLQVAAKCTARDDFFTQLDAGNFDIALIDVSIGRREGGLDILREILRRGDALPVIMLSAHDEIDYALTCLMAGARGYVNKNHICSELVNGISAVLNGKLYVSGRHGEQILARYQSVVPQ